MQRQSKNFTMTRNVKENVFIPTRVEVYKLGASRREAEITIKSPSSTYLLKQTANLLKGSPTPGHPLDGAGVSLGSKKKQSRVWSVSLREIYHLALLGGIQYQGISEKSLCKTLAGSAKSIGLILKGR